MQDIRFYDFEFHLLHIEPHFISANWTINYNDIGTFEAHFDLSSDAVSVVMEHDYLVAVQGGYAAIVTSKTAIEDLAVYGRTCNWILTRRVTPKFAQQENTVDFLTASLIQQAFSDIYQKENGIEIEQSPGVFANQVTFARDKMQTTFQAVQECLANDNAGHEMRYDVVKKKWVYRVFKGEKRPFILSEDNHNAYDTEYTEDGLDLYTGGWYLEKTKNSSGSEIETPVYYDLAGGAHAQDGIYRWDCMLSGKNESERKSELLECRRSKSALVKCKDLYFGKEYRLGDILKVQVVKGTMKMTVPKRITGVNIWTEANNSGEQPIFEDYEEPKETATEG